MYNYSWGIKPYLSTFAGVKINAIMKPAYKVYSIEYKQGSRLRWSLKIK